MDTVQTKEYLSIAAEMEKELYTQKRAIKQMQARIKELGNPQQFPIPEKVKNPGRGIWMYAILALSVVLAIIMMYMISELNKPNPHPEDPITHGMAFIVILAMIIGVGWLLVQSLKLFSRTRRYYKYDKEKYDRYVAENTAYKNQMAADKQRIKSELKEKESMLAGLAMLQAQHEESKQTMEKIYSAGIIFPKYRNFVMVCSLYEYFCTGRCSTLEGHEGGYNILESELRANLVIAKLDEVITQLNRIEQNQYFLHSAIQESNRNAQQLVASVEDVASAIRDLSTQHEATNARIAELQQHSELTAYHTERVQKELSYLNRMNYLTGNNDGVFYNFPPS